MAEKKFRLKCNVILDGVMHRYGSILEADKIPKHLLKRQVVEKLEEPPPPDEKRVPQR